VTTRRRRHVAAWLAAGTIGGAGLALAPALATGSAGDRSLDAQLTERLSDAGFTGRIESTLTERLGRSLDPRRADTGRLLWFDTILGLNDDNACAGCDSPTAGFGDTQSIAIGIDSNRVVGSDRAGPRNQRRAPMVLNTGFYPSLMLNDRFSSVSGDPFDPSLGLLFPPPAGTSLSYLPHLLDAQAFIPPTERSEAAGFAFPGDNEAIRAEVVGRLNASPAYRKLFARFSPTVRAGGPITYDLVASAIAEFELSLTFADAPIDRFARGERSALDDTEKRGALLFFGDAGCVSCHQVSGRSNEMFSDFREHVLGVPQLVPARTNVPFDGPGANEDFGREQFTGDPADRYAFRTSPLRNVALQPTFMHDGAFTSLAAAIRHHLDVVASALSYDPVAQGVDPDVAGPVAPVALILARLDPLVATPRALSQANLDALVAFVRDGLLDPRASPERLRRLIPESLPSGRAPLVFQTGG
jgi:cytochrome c peroxidase